MTVDWVLKNFCLVVLFFSSRSSHRPNGGRRPIDELLCACMHARALCAAAAAAVHAFSVNSAKLRTSNDSF